VLDDNNLVIQNPARTKGHIVVSLDNRYYKKVDDLQARFPDGIPDLLACEKLTISGDVKFGSDVKVVGDVTITNNSDQQLVLTSNSVLDN
jgi:UTP--glucose-1-phosphate uridylyltransferase